MRQFFRVFLWITGIIAVLIVAAMGGFLYWYSQLDHDPLDVGPYRGHAVAIPQSAPTSSLEMGGFMIECHGHANQPVILVSRHRHGSVVGAWQIGYAWEGGKEFDIILGPADVNDLRKKNDGWVVWGGIGSDCATYYFDKNGKLIYYYISWD